MGRAPCCDKANVKRGPWSPDEDTTLKNYLEKHGTGGNWIALPQKAGLKRCGKSCRLRWLNYLRPDIKHGGFTDEEDNIICSLFKNIGSRWSVIASHLPGRTDNDVKNYWNTKLKKKLLAAKTNFTTNNMNANNNQIHLTPSLLPGSKTGYENHSFSNYFNKSCITTPMDFTPKQNVGSSTNPIQFPLHHHGVLMEPSSEFGVSANNNPSSSVSSSQEISSLSVPSTLALDNGNISWWSGTVGDEYDRLLMDFGLGSSYDLLNGYSLDHERINEVAAPNQANSLYGNFLANTADIKSEVMYQSITN